jgi:hypothetical protein
MGIGIFASLDSILPIATTRRPIRSLMTQAKSSRRLAYEMLGDIGRRRRARRRLPSMHQDFLPTSPRQLNERPA